MILRSLYLPVLTCSQPDSSIKVSMNRPLNHKSYKKTAKSIANNSRDQACARRSHGDILGDLKVYRNTEHDLDKCVRCKLHFARHLEPGYTYTTLSTNLQCGDEVRRNDVTISKKR
jgi:hypothetical protein